MLHYSILPELLQSFEELYVGKAENTPWNSEWVSGDDTGSMAERYAQLCAGEAENRFDRVLREKVYPVIAWAQCMPREHRE